MRIYIDEAGPFVPPQPPRPLFSLVLTLIIPSSIERELFYEFLRLRDTWPNQNVEVKGSSLDESQAAQLITLVLRYDTLVRFIALDANTHPDALLENFKNSQADAVTANINREHRPGPIPHLYQLGEAVRQLSNQLFLQAFATWELIIETIREGTVYYVHIGILEEASGPPCFQVDHGTDSNRVHLAPGKREAIRSVLARFDYFLRS